MNIEKNIPVPQELKAGRKAVYPFADMAIGDSFVCKNKNVRAAACLHGKKYDKKFQTQAVKDGFRVWRVG